MAGIQLILTDIDGTLVPAGSHEISERVRDVVVAAESAGIAVVPVTGRPYEMARSVLTVLGFDGLCIVDGGASIRDARTGKLIWSYWLDPATIRTVVRLLAPACTLIDYDPAQWMRSQHEIDAGAITEPAPYIFAEIHEAAAEGLLAQLQAMPLLSTHLLPRRTGAAPHTQALQVTHMHGNKRHGMQELLRLLAVAPAHTMAVGDGDNDMPLFEQAALRVAVGNASQGLKAMADHIVASVEDDGFAETVERFVLTPP